MPEMKKYAPGTPCWVELATTDIEAAKKFYGDVLGWKDYEVGGEETGHYTTPKLDGKRVAGMMTQMEEQKSMGVPPNWATYVNVKSADDTAKKVAGLGGTVIVEPMDVMEFGRMAVFLDTEGAAICAWQANQHHGSEVVNEHGAFCWSELYTRDPEKAKTFYSELFGWKPETHEGEMTYTEWKVGDRSVGGMIEIAPEMGPMPPNWLTYFAVDDCDKASEAANQGGGNVAMGPMDIPNVGRFAVIADPQHAVFAVIKMAEQHETS